MDPLPRDASDADLVAFVERWTALLDAEDYEGAFAMVDHETTMGWTPELMREVIKRYGDARDSQRVTLAGDPSDAPSRTVTRWPAARAAGIGEIWYDLNIDGRRSDLTATFWIVETRRGLIVRLNDIHVM